MQEGLRLLSQGGVQQVILARPEWKKVGKSTSENLKLLNEPALQAIDALLGSNAWVRLQDTGQLVLKDFADLKGLSLDNTYVLADEVQNSSAEQLKLVCVRPRENCKIVLTGDPQQTDRNKANWATQVLEGYARKLEPSADRPDEVPVPTARCVRFVVGDVVRSEAAKNNVEVFEEMEALEHAEHSGRLGARALSSIRGSSM